MTLFNKGFSNNFWIKTIETIYYLCNKLSTKGKNNRKVIFKEL